MGTEQPLIPAEHCTTRPCLLLNTGRELYRTWLTGMRTCVTFLTQAPVPAITPQRHSGSPRASPRERRDSPKGAKSVLARDPCRPSEGQPFESSSSLPISEPLRTRVQGTEVPAGGDRRTYRRDTLSGPKRKTRTGGHTPTNKEPSHSPPVLLQPPPWRKPTV